MTVTLLAPSITESDITFAELSRFLDSASRIVWSWKSDVGLGLSSPTDLSTPSSRIRRRAPSYELELYLAVDKCKGLERGLLSITMRAGARWCPMHPPSARMISKRC